MKTINVFGIIDDEPINTCNDCRYFVPYVDGNGHDIYGICHRYPNPLKIEGENCSQHWCGEFSINK